MPTLNGVPFENPVWTCPDGTMREEDWPHITQTRYPPPPGFYWVRWRMPVGVFCAWTVAEVSAGWHHYSPRFRVIGGHEGEAEKYDIRDAEWVTLHQPDITLAAQHETSYKGFFSEDGRRICCSEEECCDPAEHVLTRGVWKLAYCSYHAFREKYWSEECGVGHPDEGKLRTK